MFKTDLSLSASFQKLMKEDGWAFMGRGMTSCCYSYRHDYFHYRFTYVNWQVNK
jgi:hypothetical protein